MLLLPYITSAVSVDISVFNTNKCKCLMWLKHLALCCNWTPC